MANCIVMQSNASTYLCNAIYTQTIRTCIESKCWTRGKGLILLVFYRHTHTNQAMNEGGG